MTQVILNSQDLPAECEKMVENTLDSQGSNFSPSDSPPVKKQRIDWDNEFPLSLRKTIHEFCQKYPKK